MKKFFFILCLLCLPLQVFAFDYPDALCQWQETGVKNIEVFRFVPRTTCERSVFPFSVNNTDDVWEVLYFDGALQVYNTALGVIVAYDGKLEGRLKIIEDNDLIVSPVFREEVEKVIRSIFPKRTVRVNW